MFAKCLTASAFILAALISINVQAKTLSTAQAELQSYKTQLMAAQADVTKYSAALKEKEAKIASAANAPSPEKDKYEAAKKTVADLETIAANDPSQAGELRNAKFKLTLADRKFKKSNKQLQQLSNDRRSIQSQLADSQAKVAKLEDSIKSQDALVAKLTLQSAANEQNRLEQQRVSMEKLQAENERLKAQQQAEATLAARKAEQERVEAVRLAEEANKVPAIPDRSSRSTVTLITSPEDIAGEQQRLLVNTENGGGEAKGNKKYMTVRIPGELTRSISMVSEGGDQYRGQSKIAGGDAAISLDKFNWKTSVPASNANKKMTFLLDLSDSAKPYLVFFASQ